MKKLISINRSPALREVVVHPLSDPLDRFPISLRHVEPPPFIDHRGDERFVGHFGPTGVFSRA
jgi:hypothetical protein